MGDYDSAAPLYNTLPGIWSDPNRGSIPLVWGINPNLIDTYPDLIKYFYQTATANDYFAPDASAAGYMNPNRIQEQYLPLFISHNTTYYNDLDMTISPMVLDWDQPTSAVKDAYAQFSPDGYSTITMWGFPNTSHNTTGNAPVPQVWNGMPILNLLNQGSITDTINYLTPNLPEAGLQPTFTILRVDWDTPTNVINAINKLKINRPDLNIQVVDPYNFFRLAKQNSSVWASDTVNSAYAATSGVMGHLVGRSDGAGGWAANITQDTSSGYLLYGPYDTTIPVGEKAASFSLKIDNNTADNANVALIDVYDGTSELASTTITRKQFVSANTYQSFELPFNVLTAGKSMQFRVFWYNNNKMTVDNVAVINKAILTYEATSGVVGHLVGRSDGVGGWAANITQDTSSGYLLYGPYDIAVPVGQKTVSFALKIDNNTADSANVALIDVYDGTSELASTIITRKQFVSANTYQSFELPFNVLTSGKPMQFRVFWYNNNKMTVDKVEINNYTVRDYEAESGVMGHSVGRSDGAGGWAANITQDTGAGYLQYGPYDTSLSVGQKTASFSLEIDNNSADNANVALIDAYNGTSVLASTIITRKQFVSTNTYQYFNLPFTIPSLNSSMEFRIYWYHNSKLTVDKTEITQP